MSLFKKNVPLKEEEEVAPVMQEYSGQHPMLSFKSVSAIVESDHLDQYMEVHPFESSEPNKQTNISLKSVIKKVGQNKVFTNTEGKMKGAALRDANEKYAKRIIEKEEALNSYQKKYLDYFEAPEDQRDPKKKIVLDNALQKLLELGREFGTDLFFIKTKVIPFLKKQLEERKKNQKRQKGERKKRKK